MTTKHATVNMWQREEDGSYHTELDGHALHVRWQAPRRFDDPRGFAWDATLANGTVVRGDDLVEEPEVAMACAESAVGANAAANVSLAAFEPAIKTATACATPEAAAR
jgi:hypothetical protein